MRRTTQDVSTDVAMAYFVANVTLPNGRSGSFSDYEYKMWHDRLSISYPSAFSMSDLYLKAVTAGVTDFP